MQKMILFVDNAEDFLDVHARLLEYRGYQIVRATSIAEAKSQLQRSNVHLMVSDIRLEEDNDPQDISGLTLAENGLYRYLPKIMLTAHPSWQYAEKALGAGLGGMRVVEMVAKADGTDRILDAVDRAFADHVLVNWSLVIRGDDTGLLTLPQVATSMTPTLEGEQLSLYTDEVQELLSRLFLEHNQIYIDRMVARISGRVWLVVSAFTKQGDERQYLVIMGKRSLIAADQSQFNKLNPKNSTHHLVKQWQGETAHYAAYAAVLPGIRDLDAVATLRHRPIEQMSGVIQQLFEVVLTPWYQDGRSWETEKGLSPLYEKWLGSIDLAQTEADLMPRIQSICEQASSLGLARLDYSPQRLTLHLPQEEPIMLPNPLTALTHIQMETTEPVLYGTAHGKLDGTAVLTDTQNNCWIIDYAHVNRGPLLQDFVCLEAAIKYDMLVMPDFSQRYKMENHLLAASRLDDDIVTEDVTPEIAKAIEAIVLVRKWAAKIGIKMAHYRLGLILHVLGRLLAYRPDVRHTRRELIPYLHNLVSAAMIQQQLVAPSRPDLPSQAIYGLWIDEEREEVWVEGQAIDLTAQEYELLHYLYQRAGENCSRDMIMKDVFELEYEPDWSEKQRRDFSDPRINSAISRLRKKIESDSSQPKYLKSVWGSGYKLNLEA
jgi:DNA-binding response OmpR family regulator